MEKEKASKSLTLDMDTYHKKNKTMYSDLGSALSVILSMLRVLSERRATDVTDIKEQLKDLSQRDVKL